MVGFVLLALMVEGGIGTAAVPFLPLVGGGFHRGHAD